MPDEFGELQKVVINAGVGFVLPFYGETAPPGTLACDGSEISRAAYGELFQVLGTKAGAGDGSTTFNLPDLRGQFVRGTGGNAAALGVEQGDAIRDIVGTFCDCAYQNQANPDDVYLRCTGAFRRWTESTSNRTGPTLATQEVIANGGDGAYLDVSLVVPTAVENRPTNVALLWCIIYE